MTIQILPTLATIQINKTARNSTNYIVVQHILYTSTGCINNNQSGSAL